MTFRRRVLVVMLGYVVLALGVPVGYGVAAGVAEGWFGVGDPLEGRFGEVMLGLSALYVGAATGWLVVHWRRWVSRRSG